MASRQKNAGELPNSKTKRARKIAICSGIAAARGGQIVVSRETSTAYPPVAHRLSTLHPQHRTNEKGRPLGRPLSGFTFPTRARAPVGLAGSRAPWEAGRRAAAAAHHAA